MPDIDVTLKLKDELTAGAKKAASAMGDLDDAAKGMVDSIIDGQPDLEKFRGELNAMFSDVADGSKSMEDAKKRISEMGSEMKGGIEIGGGFNKQIKGMAKGLIGVGTAYAAGRALVDFTKDSLAAAKAAGRLDSSFVTAGNSTQSLKEEVGVMVSQKLKPAANAFTDVSKAVTTYFEFQNKLNDAVSEGIITQEEMNDVIVLGRDTRLESAEGLEWLTEKERAYNQTLSEQRDIRDTLINLPPPEIAPRGEGVTESAQASIDEFLLERHGGKAFGIQGDLSGQAGGAIDQLQLMEEGQLEVQDTYNLVVQAYREGTLSLEDTERELTKVAVQSTRNALAAGDFNSEQDAAISLAGDLGITMGEALEMIRNMDTEAEGLPSGIEKTNEAVGQLQKDLDAMVKKQYELEVIIKLSGAGSFLIGGSPVVMPDFRQGRASGGPVSGGSSYIVGERGPELFSPGTSGNITPNSQMGMNTAALESKFDALANSMANAMLDMQQTVAEAMG